MYHEAIVRIDNGEGKLESSVFLVKGAANCSDVERTIFDNIEDVDSVFMIREKKIMEVFCEGVLEGINKFFIVDAVDIVVGSNGKEKNVIYKTVCQAPDSNKATEIVKSKLLQGYDMTIGNAIEAKWVRIINI